MARVGKIARLPTAVREELNLRVLEGQSGVKILPWLNGLAEVQKILAEEYQGNPINDQNLSDYRHGGHVDWLNHREKVARIRDLAHLATQLAQANGSSIAEGAAAIASGQILQILEACEGKMEAEELSSIISGLGSLRAAETATARLGVEREKLKHKEQEIALERQKFQRTTCELFLKWRENERASAIAESTQPNSEKIEQLGRAMFGELWRPE